MKVSLIIPIYFNQDNLIPLYSEIVHKLYPYKEIDWELVMVNDGSKDDSYNVIKKLHLQTLM